MAYVGFKALESKLSGKVRNPGAVAAAIGRKKYGAERFNAAAAAGKSMRGMEPMSHLPEGYSQSPMGNIGAARGCEAKEIGTFKGAPKAEYKSPFKVSKPNQTYESFKVGGKA